MDYNLLGVLGGAVVLAVSSIPAFVYASYYDSHIKRLFCKGDLAQLKKRARVTSDSRIDLAECTLDSQLLRTAEYWLKKGANLNLYFLGLSSGVDEDMKHSFYDLTQKYSPRFRVYSSNELRSKDGLKTNFAVFRDPDQFWLGVYENGRHNCEFVPGSDDKRWPRINQRLEELVKDSRRMA